MKQDVRSAFADIHRRLPGRYDHLQRAIEAGETPVAEDFRRLVRAYEDELTRLEHQGRMSGSFPRW